MPPKSRPARAEPAPAAAAALPAYLTKRPSTPWLWLLPIVTVLPYLLSVLHYSLPEPLPPM